MELALAVPLAVVIGGIRALVSRHCQAAREAALCE
jgi:hypothetical protein